MSAVPTPDRCTWCRPFSADWPICGSGCTCPVCHPERAVDGIPQGARVCIVPPPAMPLARAVRPTIRCGSGEPSSLVMDRILDAHERSVLAVVAARIEAAMDAVDPIAACRALAAELRGGRRG